MLVLIEVLIFVGPPIICLALLIQAINSFKKKKWLLGVVSILSATFLGWLLLGGYRLTQAGSHVTHCNSNLKNIGTAMELYSADWGGKYASSFEQLTPKYLKTLPSCPAGEGDYTLQAGMDLPGNEQGYQDYYLLVCQGDGHRRANVDPDFPRYNSLRGLISSAREWDERRFP